MSEVEIDYERACRKIRCEDDHLYFTRYFFKQRQNLKFRVNWHHQYIATIIDDIIHGRRKNVIINVAPGSSKTEIVVVNLIARGLALNPRARFLHLSYSDDLASLNSSTARAVVTSDEFQNLWPMKISDDSSSKKRWNVMVDGREAGGVYATSLGGQITGFRAGHMAGGFQGAIVIDDPLKPEDGFSASKILAANRKLVTTVESRRANPDTPIILIMQRIAKSDPSGFLLDGGMTGVAFDHIQLPALMDEPARTLVPEKFRARIDTSVLDVKGRCSYWSYKEPLDNLLGKESGSGTDESGKRIGRHVFASQYQQNPVALGGNMIRGQHFVRYKLLPKLKFREIYADTAQKTKERNDFSVFQCWGYGVDNKAYLLDLIRGKWEAPELQKRAEAFWAKHKALDVENIGHLRKMKVEDKSSGTGLIQTLKLVNHIPIEGIERDKDKVTRVMDALPYIESNMVCIPEDAPFTNDFVTECEAFSADDSHDFDDQVDPMVDAVIDMLSSTNHLKVWAKLAK